MPPLLTLLGVWLLLVNVVTFVVFAADKRAAASRLPRVPERRLLQLTLLGGGVGGFAAQQTFRHKTRKQPFQTRFRLIVGLQIAAAALLSIAAAGRLFQA